jgi:short subunit fatty acids transporter
MLVVTIIFLVFVVGFNYCVWNVVVPWRRVPWAMPMALIVVSGDRIRTVPLLTRLVGAPVGDARAGAFT